MDIKHLRSFCTLGETLHFGRAAARLNIVQPALSGHIKQIEEELGVRLVERSRHHVFMTSAGHNFLQEARRILQQMSEAIDTTRHIAAGTIGKLHIGFVSSAVPLFVTKMIQHFSAVYPDVEIDLSEMNSSRQLEAIEENRLDIGFVRMPIQRSHVHIRTVAREPFEVVLPEGHPLDDGSPLAPTDLTGETVLMLARDNAPGFHDALFSAFHQNKIIPRRIRYFREFTTAIHLASSGLGVAVVPSFAAYAAPKHIRRVRLDLGASFSEIGLAVGENTTPLVRNACAVVDEFVKQNPLLLRDQSQP